MRISGMTARFTGTSGKQYSFHVYPFTENCPDEAGIYIFCKGTQQPGGVINLKELYIGRAASFDNRFYDHHKMECIKKNGATHICLLSVPNEQERIRIEDDLLYSTPTTCNEVKNPVTPK